MPLADWDFSHANYSLDATHFISAPTALKDDAPSLTGCLCRHADTLALAEGRIVSYFRATASDRCNYWFRQQDPLGQASMDDGYLVRIRVGFNECRLYRYVDGVGTRIGTWDYVPFGIPWHHYRITWFNGFDSEGTPALCVSLEHQDGGDWASAGTLYDTVNMYKDSEINRCGLSSYYSPTWHDDTEIWGPC